jgi:hypothetical protein
MASSSDPWMKEYTEASKLVDDISSMIADRGSLPQSGPEIMRHTSAIRRKITILGTRLDSLVTLLSRIPPKSLYVLLRLLFLYALYTDYHWSLYIDTIFVDSDVLTVYYENYKGI